MLVYFECFNTVQIALACLRRIFQCGRVYLHFTYNDIYICYTITGVNYIQSVFPQCKLQQSTVTNKTITGTKQYRN